MVGAMNWFNFFEKFKMSNLGFKIITIIAALVYLSSCAKTVYAPAINFENNSHSYSPIKNVKVIWNGLRLIEESDLDVCRSSKHSIYLDEISSFFGPVHVEWENAKGEKFIKDFIFKKDDLPIGAVIANSTNGKIGSDAIDGGHPPTCQIFYKVAWNQYFQGVIIYTENLAVVLMHEQ